MNILQLSWKNLTNKPLSMLLSILLLALGVGMISMLFLLNTQMQDKFDKNLAGVNLVIGAKGSPLQLILCNMYHIDAPTGNISLKEARPFLNPKHPLIDKAVPLSLGDSHEGYRIVGTTHSLLEFYDAKVAKGKLWSSNFEVTIGTSVAKLLNLKIGDTFKSSHGFVKDDNLIHEDGESFRVVGIFAPSGSVLDQLILTNTQSVWLVHDHDHSAHDHGDHSHEGHNHDSHDHSEDDHAHHHHDHDHEGHSHDGHDHAGHDHSHAEVTAVTPVTIAQLLEEDDSKEITSLLVKFKSNNYQTLNMQRSINENTDMQAATPAIEINRVYSMLGVGEEFLRWLAIIIIFVSGLSVFISLFSSLKDRKYELSLMRVMGASQVKLFMLIILEGLLLAFIGYVLGMLLSHGGMELLANYMQEAYRYTFTGKQFLPKEGLLFLATLLIGFIAALIPAIQAYQTNISETLTNG